MVMDLDCIREMHNQILATNTDCSIYLDGVDGWYRDGGGLGPVESPVYTGLLS